jgi:hypothetical protein
MRHRLFPIFSNPSSRSPLAATHTDIIVFSGLRKRPRNLANFTPASAEKGYLSATRFMSPELLSRFEPVAREQLKQIATISASRFFTVDSVRVEGKDPLVVTFLYAQRRDAPMVDPACVLELMSKGQNSQELKA